MKRTEKTGILEKKRKTNGGQLRAPFKRSSPTITGHGSVGFFTVFADTMATGGEIGNVF